MKVELFKCWEYKELYVKAITWVNHTPNVYVDRVSGFSYINGSSFYQYIIFDNDEDALAFKLKFSDLVKFK